MATAGALGQTPNAAPTSVNFQVWPTYEGYHPFVEGKPWGVFLEIQNKFNHGIFDEAGVAIRGGLNYDMKSGDAITGGYAFYYNYPYDRAAPPYKWLENRIWQQYYLRRRSWGLRFRMDERWLQRKAPLDYNTVSHYQFENTFRFLARNQWRFGRRSYFVAWDEVFLRVPPKDAERLVDQNRIYGGVGFFLNDKKHWRFEVGYQYQATFNSVDTLDLRKRINHCIRLTISTDAPLKGRN